MYIVLMFIIGPLVILGISLLFEINTIGIIFGTLICLIILGSICKLVYWYYYENGKQYLIVNMSNSDYDYFILT